CAGPIPAYPVDRPAITRGSDRQFEMNYPNIYSLFVDRIKRFRSGESRPRDVFYFRRDEEWQGISWDRFDEEAHHFATALLSLGLKKGGAVAILMGNVPQW